MEKSTSKKQTKSLDESGDDESEDTDFEVSDWENAKRASIEDFYTKAEPIRDISTSSIEMRRNDEQLFVDLLVKNEYLFEAVRDFFGDARKHVFIEDACRRALLDMVEQALDRRSELCYLYKLEVCAPDKNYPVNVLEDVEEEIHVFMATLQPFVLNDEDVEKDERLITSVFNSISTVYRKVSESRESVLHELEKAKDSPVRNSAGEKVTSEDDTKMPPPTAPTDRQSSEESVSQQAESQSTVVTTSTCFGTPNKK